MRERRAAAQGEIPRGPTKDQEGSGLRKRLIPWAKVANLRREQSLEGGTKVRFQGGETRSGELGVNARKVIGSERDEGSAEGKGPEG